MAGAPAPVRIGLIDGPYGVGIVTAVTSESVHLRCEFERDTPERPSVDLLLALPRPKVMKRLWAQLAAMGVGRVVLTNASKVERDYFDSHVLQEAGYRPLLLEGLQQARDTRVPLVSIHKRHRVLLEDELDQLCPQRRRALAHPGTGATVATALGTHTGRALLAIGPEGGWNEYEVGLLEAHGFQRAAMGTRVLATTTACVALLALAHETLRTEG